MSTEPADDIRQDPAMRKLLERMPVEVQQSFTEAQLSYLRVALGARQWGKHKFDLRGTVGFGSWRYYYVLVAGRNKRSEHRSHKAGLLVKAVLLSVLLLLSTALGLLLLYLLKSALGIDLFADYSLGIWSWFQAL